MGSRPSHMHSSVSVISNPLQLPPCSSRAPPGPPSAPALCPALLPAPPQAAHQPVLQPLSPGRRQLPPSHRPGLQPPTCPHRPPWQQLVPRLPHLTSTSVAHTATLLHSPRAHASPRPTRSPAWHPWDPQRRNLSLPGRRCYDRCCCRRLPSTFRPAQRAPLPNRPP